VATFFSFSPIDGVTSANLKVYLFDPTTGVLSLQTLGTDYTFGSGGVIFVNPPSSGRRVILFRQVSLLQPDVYKTNTPFPAVVTENRFDEIVKGMQQINDVVQNRSIVLPIGEAGFSANTLPTVENRKGRVLYFNDTTGDPEAKQLTDTIVAVQPWAVSFMTQSSASAGLADIGAVAKAGGTMTGFLTLHADPSSSMHAATKQYVDSVLAPTNYVLKSGDTMTGDLTISKSTPMLRLDSPTVTTRGMQFRTNGVLRWQLFAWNDAESGGNAGTTFYLSRYDDAGVFLSNIFSVDRATGRWTFLGSVLPRVPAVDPTDNNDVVRKAYADYMAPPGAVMAFARSSVPTGWLKCNGAAVSRTTYANLFAAIGTTYGAGDGSTTFNLPDLRGEFIRGYDDGRGVDSGRGFGTAQLDAFQGHYHGPRSPLTSFWGGSSASGSYIASASPAFQDVATTGGPVSDGTNGTPRTAAETRPRNVALMYCIKY
jgi:microcystin-dependent protein